MDNDNRVSAALTAQNVTDIKGHIQAIRALLPFLLELSAEDRRELPKLGDKSVGFDTKVANYIVSNPEFLPGFINNAEVLKDRVLRAQFLEMLAPLRTLCQLVEDTFMIINSEIWMADLAYYGSVREAARRKRPGAEGIYADLKERFPGANPQAAPPPPQP